MGAHLMAKKKSKKLKLPHGFKSKAQMRYFFARPDLKKKWARKIAHRGGMHSAITKKLGYSPAYRKLPKHVRHRGRRRAG
jgi:hypothetical protein